VILIKFLTLDNYWDRNVSIPLKQQKIKARRICNFCWSKYYCFTDFLTDIAVERLGSMSTNFAYKYLRSNSINIQNIVRSLIKGKQPKAKYYKKILSRAHESAVEALLGATHAGQGAGTLGLSAYRRESRIYWHDSCGPFHLTSQAKRKIFEVSNVA